MERTDVKNNHTEEYSTGQIRCIEKSDPEYPQIMKQYSSMPAKLYVKGRRMLSPSRIRQSNPLL